MRHPAFNTLPGSLLYLGTFILAGGLLPLCLLGLTPLPAGLLVLQGAFSGLLFCGLSVLLWFIIKYTRLGGKSVYERFITHIVLIGILLLIWQGCEHLFLYLLLKESVFQEMATLIPCKLVVGVLVSILVIQLYSRPVSQPILDETEEDEMPHVELPPVIEPGRKQEILSPLDKLTVKSGSNIHFISLQDLNYIQAEGDYVVLFTATGRHIKEETMKNLETQLPPNFLRVHRSCIVNTESISRIELYEKQHYLITLKTGQQVRASLNGYKLLKERLRL